MGLTYFPSLKKCVPALSHNTVPKLTHTATYAVWITTTTLLIFHTDSSFESWALQALCHMGALRRWVYARATLVAPAWYCLFPQHSSVYSFSTLSLTSLRGSQSKKLEWNTCLHRHGSAQFNTPDITNNCFTYAESRSQHLFRWHTSMNSWIADK